MKQAKKKADYRREWMIVPQLRSMTYATDPKFYDRIAAQTCAHCKKSIGFFVGVYVYHPDLVAAHIRCTDEAEQANVALRSSAFMVDAAAKLAGITQDGFRALDVWEKDRLIAAVLEAKKGGVCAGK